MGISISARLLYGCYYADLPEEILDEVNEMLDDDEIDYASPYYDSPRDEWIVGVRVSCNGLDVWEIEEYLDNTGYAGIPQFIRDTEVTLGLYVSAHVT